MIENLVSPASLAELKRIELRSKRTVNTDLAGQYRSSFRGSGLVFSDIREYLPGDDVKHIHWKVTARSGKVYIKSYEEDRELNIIVALDVSNSTTSGSRKSKYRRGLEFCGLISMLAKMNLDSLGLCLFSDKIDLFLPVSKSRTQFKRVLLELIKDREHSQNTSISQALKYLTQNLKRRSIIFLISDFFSDPYLEDLRLLSFKHDVVAVMLEDDLDYSLPNAGLVEFRDAETGQYLVIDTANKKTRAKLKEAHDQRIRSWKENCKKSGCDYLELRDNPIADLSRLMQRRNQRIR